MKKVFKIKYYVYLAFVFLLMCVCESFAAGPGDAIDASIQASKEAESKERKAIQMPHDSVYYPYHPDYDKSSVITWDKPGAIGGGGGASGVGSKRNDSSGTGSSGNSGSLGKSAGSSGQNIVKTQEQINAEIAAQKQAELALQESIKVDQQKEMEKRIAEMQKAVNRANEEAAIQESIKQESILESQRIEQKYIEESRQKQAKGIVSETKKVDETTEKPKIQESIKKPTGETTIRTTDVVPNLPKNSPLKEIPTEPSTTIEVENVTREETLPLTLPLTLPPTLPSTIEAIRESIKETETIKPTEKETEKSIEETILPPKEGDKGDSDTNDPESSYKKQGGENLKDGVGSAIGDRMSGIKVLEIKRNGNIGLTEEEGHKNVKLFIMTVAGPTLLFAGIFYFFIKRLISKLFNNKKKFII